MFHLELLQLLALSQEKIQAPPTPISESSVGVLSESAGDGEAL